VKFAIQLRDGRLPRLARFESLLSAGAGQTTLRDAQQRLAHLELTLADAEDDVECKQAELAESRSAYWRTRFSLQRLVAPLQNTTYIAGLLAALAAFAALFVFKRPERLPGVAIAVLFAVTGWAFHREWQEAEAQERGESDEAKAAVKDAERELQGSMARLEDQTLEREFVQRQMRASRSHGGAGPA
jgi:uncharacterized coiled-coil protein SlyX